MNEKLLIIGAGVDRTQGIDFPLANTLLADVSRYLETEGKEVEGALRKMLPGLRFTFNSMIARQVDKIATREVHEQREMVIRLKKVLEELSEGQEKNRKLGELIVRLFEKLAAIAKENSLDEKTESLIREVFPKDADELLDSDSILDIHKLSLSDTFKAVLKRTLRMGLGGEHNEVAAALGADMLNIETLMVEKFLGFYNNKIADIKNYLYISWALWAFLVDRQKAVLDNHEDGVLPFYGSIPDDVRALTLNYTAFLQNKLGSENSIYFHGGLAECVRMDTRDVMRIENVLDCKPSEFIKNIVWENIDVSSEDIRQHRHVIPALVPPLRLKPILSHKYIDLWAKAAQWIGAARHIVVIGYSFNSADEHFNDILRCNNDGRNIDIIAPEATSKFFKERMEKVFNIPADQFNANTVQGCAVLQARHIRLISAKALEIDISTLFQDSH